MSAMSGFRSGAPYPDALPLCAIERRLVCTACRAFGQLGMPISLGGYNQLTLTGAHPAVLIVEALRPVGARQAPANAVRGRGQLSWIGIDPRKSRFPIPGSTVADHLVCSGEVKIKVRQYEMVEVFRTFHVPFVFGPRGNII